MRLLYHFRQIHAQIAIFAVDNTFPMSYHGDAGMFQYLRVRKNAQRIKKEFFLMKKPNLVPAMFVISIIGTLSLIGIVWGTSGAFTYPPEEIELIHVIHTLVHIFVLFAVTFLYRNLLGQQKKISDYIQTIKQGKASEKVQLVVEPGTEIDRHLTDLERDMERLEKNLENLGEKVYRLIVNNDSYQDSSRR